MASCSHKPGTSRLQNSCLVLSPSCAVTAETSPGLTTLPTDLGLRPHCLMKHVKRAHLARHTYRPRAMEFLQRSQNCDLRKQCPSSWLSRTAPRPPKTILSLGQHPGVADRAVSGTELLHPGPSVYPEGLPLPSRPPVHQITSWNASNPLELGLTAHPRHPAHDI